MHTTCTYPHAPPAFNMPQGIQLNVPARYIDSSVCSAGSPAPPVHLSQIWDVALTPRQLLKMRLLNAPGDYDQIPLASDPHACLAFDGNFEGTLGVRDCAVAPAMKWRYDATSQTLQNQGFCLRAHTLGRTVV